MGKSTELLLESTISKETGKIKSKLDFWGINLPVQIDSLWENSDTLALEQILIGLKEEELRYSPTARILCGIGWEFLWGRTPPEFIERERKSLLNKVQRSQKLSELEEFWYLLISIDTDMF